FMAGPLRDSCVRKIENYEQEEKPWGKSENY
ncbi:putative Homer, partial [Danaus plexippus plexippus]